MQKSSEPPHVLTPEYYARMEELEETLGWYRGMHEIVLRQVDGWYRKTGALRILDAGCGVGGLTQKLQKYAAAQRLVGLDLAPEALAYCRQQSKFDLVQGSLSELPFSDSSFDFITCLDVLQHVEDGKDTVALAEFLRILRPGGVLLLRVAASTGNRKPTLSHRYYRVETLVDQLSRAGFQIEKATYVNRASYWMQVLRRGLDLDYHRESLPEPPPKGPFRFLHLSWWKDKLIFHLLKREAIQLARGDRCYGHGMAVLCVARTPGSAASSAPGQ